MAEQKQGIPAPNLPPAPAQAGKQAQKQQDNVAPKAQGPAAQQ